MPRGVDLRNLHVNTSVTVLCWRRAASPWASVAEYQALSHSLTGLLIEIEAQVHEEDRWVQTCAVQSAKTVGLECAMQIAKMTRRFLSVTFSLVIGADGPC